MREEWKQIEAVLDHRSYNEKYYIVCDTDYYWKCIAAVIYYS